MKHLLIALTFLLLSSLNASAGNLTGSVIDEQGKPVREVAVLILNAKDSVLAKAAVTDAVGHFIAEALTDGTYVVKAILLGYDAAFSQPLTLRDNSAAVTEIVLVKSRKAMAEVIVRAQKPLIEARADRIIVNVENSIANTGSTAMEVLQRSPGVNVDQNDNISLKGKQGVNIMIDGKLVPVQGIDLVNTLKSMPANAI